jgi:hypothetical protein
MPPPGFGPGGPGVPPAGGGGGGKTGLIIGIVVLVLVLAGLGGFLLLRGSDKKPVAVDTTTTTTAGTTTSESTTTTEEEGPTTTRRRPTTSSSTTTSSRRSTTTTGGGGEVSIEQFDAASATVAPTIPTDERRAIGRKVCSDINSEGGVLAYLLGVEAGQYGDARLTKENFSQLVGMSIATFCPQYMKELEEIANG